MTDQLVPEGALPEGSAALRREVRAFLDEERERGTPLDRPDSWFSGWDRGFSERLAARGWVGMTLPVEYGGGGRSALERYVVVEELLAAGAPVSAHWVSDRQAGPAILAHGTSEQRRRFLPAIAAGRGFFSIGMSEQGAGSDLAAVATRAVCDDDGTWRLSGTKLWTGGAHVNDHAIVLARTDDAPADDRHAGLSQLIVDLRAPGVTVEPIRLLTGEHRFNAVHLDGAPGELLGTRGAGWAQVTGELAHERSGPERFLSTFPLLCSFLTETEGERLDATTTARLGRLVARLAALRHLSIGVAGALERGESPDIAAALVKDLGTRFEGDVVEVVREGWNSLPDLDARSGSHGELLAVGITHLPGYTLRGGTNEILRGIVTHGIAPSTPTQTARRLAAHATDEVLSDPAAFVDATWSVLADVLPAPDAPLAEQVALARAVGAHPAPGPFAEAAVVAHPLLAAAGLPIPDGSVTAVHSLGLAYEPLADDGTVWLEGIARRSVSWGRGTIVLLTDDADGPLVALVEPAVADDDTTHEPRTPYADLRPGRTLAGEPRDLLTVHRYRAPAARVSPAVATDALRRLDLARVAQIAGAAQQACDLAVAHVSGREQFGRPLATFQAVKQDLARLVEEVALVSAAVDVAVTELGSENPHDPDLALAVACVQADASITEITRIAHQLHGAVGFTELSPLRHATTRLWSWRDAWTGGSWDVWLGEAAREARWDGLWPMVTAAP